MGKAKKTKAKKAKTIKLLSAVCLLLAVILTAGCTKKKAQINSLADLKKEAYTIGMPADVASDKKVAEICSQAEIVCIEGVTFIEPLRSGKIDAFVLGKMQLIPIAKQYSADGFVVLEESLTTYDIALGLGEHTPVANFKEKVDECIRRYKEDGTMKEMVARWSGVDPVKPEIRLPENPSYTIRATTYGVIKPYTYYSDNALTGLDIELAERIAADLGCGLEWELADFPAMLAGLGAGKYDMIASNLYKTEERAESFLYSESYTQEEIGLLTVHKKKDNGFETLEDLKQAKTFASVTGTVFPSVIREHFPQAEVSEYNNILDAAIAVQNGKADATMFDEPIIAHLAVEFQGVKMIPEKLMEESYHFCTAKTEKGIALAEDINQWLAEAKENGQLEKLTDFWIGTGKPDGRCDFSSLPGKNGTLVIGTDISCRPDTYLYQGRPVGLSLDILYHYCQDRGLKADVQIMDFGAFSAALITEKIDISASFSSYTEERAESMTFTVPFYDGGIAVLVQDKAAAGPISLFSNLAESFEKTFVREDRWKMILSGLGVTLLITFGSFLLANLLGALFCGFNLSGNRALHVTADVYSRIMQGTPMVVVLMILYYVILGRTKLSGTFVSILGFGLVTGSGLAQCFEGAIRSIDRGQKEAALALGFSEVETFCGIIFPQAARTALPGYFSELISLLKGTSIVGYIAVVDLTKASDIIRASTYEAFFPLISIAIIYFVIINVLLSIMKAIQKSLEPKRVTGKEAEK